MVKFNNKMLPATFQTLLISVQAPWAQLAEYAASPREAQMAARSCAADEATTPCVSNVSPSVSASSSGAVRWSAKTARTLWTFTPANPTSDLFGWM